MHQDLITRNSQFSLNRRKAIYSWLLFVVWYCLLFVLVFLLAFCFACLLYRVVPIINPECPQAPLEWMECRAMSPKVCFSHNLKACRKQHRCGRSKAQQMWPAHFGHELRQGSQTVSVARQRNSLATIPPQVEETLGGTKCFGTKPPQLTQQAADGRSSGMSTKEVDRQGSSETMNNRAARTPPPQPLDLPQCNRQISRCRFLGRGR